MARRPSLIKVKNKKQNKSKSEQYLINRKAYGDEPVYTSKEITASKLTQCYNWYNYMCDQSEVKEYLLAYLKNTARDVEAKQVREVHEKFIPSTVGWIARMRSLGANLPQTSKDYFEDRLKTVISDGQRRAREGQTDPDGDTHCPEKPASQSPSVHDRSMAKTRELTSQIEEEHDKFITDWKTEFSMINWLRANDVSNAAAKYMHSFYNPQLLEVENAFTTDDDEGYESLKKSGKLKLLYGFLVMVVEDLELHMQNEKKTRKPRTAKPITAEKKLKDFKYMKFANGLNIQSVQPEKILGAAELWVFNTKYNQLTVFKMADPQVGLDVYRTAIAKFDPTTAKTKKLRANTVDAVLKNVLSAGKIQLRKLMDEVKGSDQKLQERMNENTILLRVVPR